MKILIRADASISIGTGHIARCLTLADRLREKGSAISFICRTLPDNIGQLIASKGYDLCVLPPAADGDGYRFNYEQDAAATAEIIHKLGAPASWIIVDHYRLDWRWQQMLRPYVGKIMVIDDLADRRHACDMLLDQNYYLDLEKRYAELVPDNCRCFLGPRYALLRDEFIKMGEKRRIRDGIVRRILVFFGGSDPTDETTKALKAISALNLPAVEIDVVVGGANPYKEEVRRLCDAFANTTFHCQVNNMAELMNRADLAVGAGGSTAWERCYLGLPCLTLIVAPNQAETTAAVAAFGAAWNLGWCEAVSSGDITAALLSLLAGPAKIKKVSDAARSLMQGYENGIDTVISAIIGE
jgi:UDP-2,4-diacetamido-2,4,6-trideoxy-beta-L-altropyranose hydrolase